ncbi:unnamed protein product [Closterium sp. NIES-64]|nr:unnamed protein product [Closterium sp. NIES-64]
MDPARGRDPALEGTAESAQQVHEPAAPRPRPSAHPSARVRAFTSASAAAAALSPMSLIAKFGSSPLAAVLQSIAIITGTALAIICPPQAGALLATHPLVVGQDSAHPERDPPHNALRGDLRRRGGGGRLDVAGIRFAASSPLRVRTRLVPEAIGAGGMAVGVAARASGEPTHVHIEVTNGPPFAADPGQMAPLRAPTLREYLPAREGRAQFRTPRQVPGFSAHSNPCWPSAFPREAPTAPPPTRAGRDPMLTMCRVLNLAGGGVRGGGEPAAGGVWGHAEFSEQLRSRVPRILRVFGRIARVAIGTRVGSARRGSALRAYFPPPRGGSCRCCSSRVPRGHTAVVGPSPPCDVGVHALDAGDGGGGAVHDVGFRLV